MSWPGRRDKPSKPIVFSQSHRFLVQIFREVDIYSLNESVVKFHTAPPTPLPLAVLRLGRDALIGGRNFDVPRQKPRPSQDGY